MGQGEGSGSGKGAMNAQGTYGQQPYDNGQPNTVVYQTTSQPVVVLTNNTARDKQERIAVPAMPMPAAIVCCILNFLIPGSGEYSQTYEISLKFKYSY